MAAELDLTGAPLGAYGQVHEHHDADHHPRPRRPAHHPGLTRYHTNLVERRLGAGDGPGWDGFTELHFANAESIAGGLFDSPEGERLVREDIAKFLSHAGAYRVAEYVHKLPQGR